MTVSELSVLLDGQIKDGFGNSEIKFQSGAETPIEITGVYNRVKYPKEIILHGGNTIDVAKGDIVFTYIKSEEYHQITMDEYLESLQNGE